MAANGMNALVAIALVAAVVGAVDFALRRAGAERRAAAFAFALLLAAAVPWAVWWRPVEPESALVIVAQASGASPAPAYRFDWWSASLWALAALAALRLAWIATGLWRLHRLRRAARAAPEPGVWIAPVGTPVTFGWRAPMIVAPAPLWASASSSTKAAILAHERAHVARRDFAWNLAIELATVPVWWHPGVVWMKRRLAVLREFACDEWAAAAEPGYAKALLDAASELAGIRRPAVALGLFDSDSLEARMLNLIRPVPVLSRRWAQGLTVFALTALALTAVVSARFPVFAAERKVYKAGEDDVQAPRVLNKVTPIYPKSAKDARAQGTVVLSLVVTEEGLADDVSVVVPVEDSLDQAAIDALRQWTFAPATRHGKPVAASATFEMRFTLAP